MNAEHDSFDPPASPAAPTGDCPGCGDETTFSSKNGGVGAGNLTCDACGYMPRKRVREELRAQQTPTGSDNGVDTV